jgi:hypothetical protein
MKPTKYVTIHVVQGRYPGPHGWEDECCSTDWREALADWRSYRENSPYPSRLIRRRVLREKYEKGEF